MSAQTSPFLPVHPGWRAVILAYVVLYQIFFPILAGLLNPEAQPLLLPRVAVESARVLLTCWPLFFYRREYGFLHPLLLPLLVTILGGIGKSPLHLIAPLDVPLTDFAATTMSAAIPLRLDPNGLARVQLYYGAVQLLATACYFLGYFLLKLFPLPALRLHAPRNLSSTCFIAISLCLAVGFLYIQLAGGGLFNHLVAMRSGRTILFQGDGQFLLIGEFAIVIVLLWFAYLKEPFTNLFWLASFSLSSVLALVISGSRSTLITALMAFLFLWWQKRRRVLVVPSVLLAIGILLIFAVFGSIRQDWGSRSIDTSGFALTSFSDNIARAQTEIQQRRNVDGDLAAFAGAQNELLWGRSYIAAAAFWVPRALWPDKPHSTGVYNMWVNYAGRPLEQFGSGTYWGIPVSAATEAFWNFHLPGVILVFALFGAFHRWLAQLVLRYPASPFILVFSTWIVINFSGDSLTFVRTIRDAILLVGLAFVLGILRLAKSAWSAAPSGARIGL